MEPSGCAPTLVIFAALRWELEPALAALTDVRPRPLGRFPSWVGRAGDRAVRVVKTGVGIAQARRAALRVWEETAADAVSWVLSTGCAGALREDLGHGALVVATDVLDSGGRPVVPSMRRDAERLIDWVRTRGLVVHPGAFYSVEQPLLTVADKRAARRATGAVAVEMEGAATAAVAAAHGISFLAVRVILDAADVDVPDILATTDGDVHAGRLVAHVARHPRTLLGLGRLMSARRVARQVLTGFFRVFLAGGALAGLDPARVSHANPS